MKIARVYAMARTLAAMFIATALVSCMGVPSGPQAQSLKQLVTLQAGQPYRCEPYLEMAIALQTLPHDDATSLLRALARSGKYDREVIILCRMLFVEKDGSPLKRAPSREVFKEIQWTDGFSSTSNFQGMYGLGGTHGNDWADWPVTLVNGVPFLIMAAYDGAYSGPYPTVPPRLFSPVYLDYCLSEGRWTSYHYTAADLTLRQQALATLLQSSLWKRSLNAQEVAYLTSEINDEAGKAAPPVPRFNP